MDIWRTGRYGLGAVGGQASLAGMGRDRTACPFTPGVVRPGCLAIVLFDLAHRTLGNHCSMPGDNIERQTLVTDGP